MKYLNALNKINGVGPQKMRRLLSHFGEPELVWQADLAELKSSKIGDAIIEKIITERKNIDPDQEWEILEKEKIRMIIFGSPEYPVLLKEIPNPPYILYVKGNFDFNCAPMISIVGSRKYTAYGAQVASAFARDLAQAGITVVSGMALGIDAIAHRGALDGSGKTVAVLGNSLEDKNIYPRANFNLSREIMENGCLLSDFPSDTPPLEFNFPASNRIIAGLSLGTLVIEAGEKSGTLITSALALEFNREIFAVPGSIFSLQSTGTNSLIKKGAKMVTSVKDILEELDLDQRKSTSWRTVEKIAKIPQNKEEEIILKILSSDPLHIDNLAKMSRLNPSSVSATLVMLEIKGWVKNIGGQNYIIT